MSFGCVSNVINAGNRKSRGARFINRTQLQNIRQQQRHNWCFLTIYKLKILWSMSNVGRQDIPSLIIRILDLLQLMFHCKRNLHMIENNFQCEGLYVFKKYFILQNCIIGKIILELLKIFILTRIIVVRFYLTFMFFVQHSKYVYRIHIVIWMSMPRAKFLLWGRTQPAWSVNQKIKLLPQNILPYVI